MLHNNLDVNSEGHLTIGGIDTVQLAKKYGTPLYIMDEDKIRDNCLTLKNAIDKNYDGHGLVIYASKAFLCKEQCKIINELGLGIDVSSGGELYTAVAAGFDMSRVYFHGNNKSYSELVFACEQRVGRIVCDNYEEIRMLNEIAIEKGVYMDISLRIKPGVDAHTHEFIRTGQIDSKFGYPLENGEAFELVKKCKEYSNINLVGINCHIGSQIFEVEPFVLAAEKLLGFLFEIKEKLDINITELNLGGGFGINYTKEDDALPKENFIESVSSKVKELCQQNNFSVPKILIEPGRSIICDAGITLYEVGNIKEIANIRNYILIDGSFTDNPRYALYQAKYTVLNASRAGATEDYVATVAGKCCESGDLIAEHINLKKPEIGDYIAVLSTGAYNHSMSSNYNKITRPPVVFVKNNTDRLVVRRETYDDLIKCDL